MFNNFFRLSIHALAANHEEADTRLIMAPVWNRAGHYIFALRFLSSIFFYLFSSPNLTGRTLDVYHTSTHGVALV